jgi:Iap family predicted aminopeptidase
MNKFWFCLIITCLPALYATGQVNSFSPQDDADILNRLKQHVYTLAADSMNGRPAGTVYKAKAGRYLVNEIRKCIPAEYEFHIRDFSFVVDDSTWNTATNICVRPDSISKPLLLVTAHYDHLPQGSPYSKEIINRNKLHPGADDNASGVAMAMEVFRALISDSTYRGPQPVLLLISGHEQGMHGTQTWLKTSQCTDSTILALNFDMIGRMDDDARILNILIQQNDSSLNHTFSCFQHAGQANGIRCLSRHDKFFQTDAGLMYKHNIPSLSFSTGMHNDYHRTTDTPEKINYPKMLKIHHVLISGLYELF